ncbi:MAG: HAMP domain-containing protein [Acidobacteria bacterium]|nr:HAMP domain-containing protein [Acidobacteriota bacterium]
MNILKSWRTKVLIHVLLVSTLTMLVFILINVTAQRAQVKRLSRQKIDLLTTAVDRATAVAMVDGKMEEVQSIVESLAVHPDVRRIRILGPDGRVAVSSDRGEIGSKTTEYLPSLAVAEATTGEATLEVDGILHELRVIPNRPRCYSCHESSREVNGYLEVDIDTAPSIRFLASALWRSVLLGFAVALVMAVAIARLMERLVHRPVIELRQKMELARGGDFGHSVDVPRDDEIGSLTASYNVLVAELKRAEQELRESHMRDLQRAEQLATLGELATGLAHEIKNPLSGIKGALEVIEAEMPLDGYREIMKEVMLQIGRINDTVNDLLTYARPREPQRSLQEINSLAETLIKFFENKVRGKNILLEFAPGDIPQVKVDPEQIRQVLLNLLLNSTQAIDGGGRIRVQTGYTYGGAVTLAVSDNGKGISAGHLQNIFRPFYTTKAQGTGLGLSISRGIIEKHGGRISVESAEGKGTTVTIHLPAVESAAEERGDAGR